MLLCIALDRQLDYLQISVQSYSLLQCLYLIGAKYTYKKNIISVKCITCTVEANFTAMRGHR